MSRRRLGSAGPVTFDSNGRGAAAFATVPPWEEWTVNRIFVSTSGGSSTAIPTATVYDGTEEGGQIIDGTYSGNRDTADFASPLDLGPGQYLTVVWEDGSPGEVGAAQLYGERRALG